MDFLGNSNNQNKDTGWQLLAIFLAIAVILLTVWAREGESGPLHTVRAGVKVVSTPISYAGAALGKPFEALGNVFRNATASTDDLTTLTQKNEELSAQVEQLEEYKLEDERLTALLSIQTAYNVTSTGARIIGRDADSYSRTVTIDKGSSDGMQMGMPVMSSNGLIGQISEVSTSSSTVRLLADEKSGVAAMIQGNRQEGVLTGSVEGLLYLEYVPTSVTVSVGDVIITSGIGGTYPKGIVIGEVIDVGGSTSDLYWTIVVKPSSGSSNFEEVLVLTGDEVELTYTPQSTDTGSATTGSATMGSAATASAATGSATTGSGTTGSATTASAAAGSTAAGSAATTSAATVSDQTTDTGEGA